MMVSYRRLAPCRSPANRNVSGQALAAGAVIAFGVYRIVV